MCGIVGQFNFSGEAVDPKVVDTMSTAIKHRGPDDSGEFTRGPVGLGFRRLAILDLSQAGHQPMSNKAGDCWIVFNGEIYNFQELRSTLERDGVRFSTKTDTEVILALYDRHGESCVKYLRGMFAFAIWDQRRQQLMLARDRVGKKPLKYYVDAQGIIFASELKAILRNPRVPRRSDPVAIHHYLTLQYVPAPRTGFEGIKKLLPGHTLIIRNGKVTDSEYWHLDFSKQVVRPEAEWSHMIRQTLDESVRLRLISDVPLGAFLSGGVDSSAVVAAMAKFSTRPVKTFSIGFVEESHNELPYARQISKLFSTDHTEFIVEPKAIDILPKLAYHYEEPFADSSALPTYYLAELTRQHVTVALNGDGGDENFAGYERYPIFLLAQRLQSVPRPLRHGALALAKLLRMARRTTMTDRGVRFLSSLQDGPARRYLEYMQYFSDEVKAEQYTPAFHDQVRHEKTSGLIAAQMAAAGSPDWLNKILYTDIKTYLPDDLLTKVDIATMAVSLEGRSPLLDHTMLELSATIPSSLKVHRGQKKYIFRQALRGIIPDDILDRPKQGFGVPIEHWFRGSLNEYIRTHLLDGRFAQRGIFEQQYLTRLVDQHTKGRVSYAYQLWSLLMLELWFEVYFDAPV